MTTEPEIMAPLAPQVVHQITSAEVDMQVATAKRFPRSLDRCLKQAKAMACKSQKTAEGCFYVLPRAGKKISGPSVRLAEILASTWGNLRAEARVVEVGQAHVMAQATVWDMETNVLVRTEVRRRITDKAGGRYNEDMINVTANAAASIALRNSMFRVIPRSVIDEVYEDAVRVAVGDAKTLDERRNRMMDSFVKMGVDVDRVLARLGRAALVEVTLDDLETMYGLFNSIKEGEIEVDTAFPGPEPELPKPAGPAPDNSDVPAFEAPKKPAPAESAKQDPPSSGLNLSELIAEMARVGVPAATRAAWQLEIGIVQGDKRTHTAKRLDELDARTSEYAQGARE